LEIDEDADAFADFGIENCPEETTETEWRKSVMSLQGRGFYGGMHDQNSG